MELCELQNLMSTYSSIRISLYTYLRISGNVDSFAHMYVCEAPVRTINIQMNRFMNKLIPIWLELGLHTCCILTMNVKVRYFTHLFTYQLICIFLCLQNYLHVLYICVYTLFVLVPIGLTCAVCCLCVFL